MCQRKDHRRSMLTLVFPSDSCDGFWMRRNLNKISCKPLIKTLILARPWHRNAWTYKSKSMQLWSLENVCKKNKWNPWQINSKWEPEAAPKGAKASKTSPEVSQRLPESFQKRQRRSNGGAGVDLVVFYTSKWEPKGILEAARASKICPEASQKRPKRHLRASSNKYTNTILEQVLKMCARMYPKACQNPWNIKWK